MVKNSTVDSENIGTLLDAVLAIQKWIILTKALKNDYFLDFCTINSIKTVLCYVFLFISNEI